MLLALVLVSFLGSGVAGPVVKTPYGSIEGYEFSGGNFSMQHFVGIPYAQVCRYSHAVGRHQLHCNTLILDYYGESEY